MHRIHTDQAPAAIGPYSQAIVHNGLVWCSGQVAFDPESGVLLAGDVASETHVTLRNLSAVLEQAGASLSSVLRCTVYLADMNDFSAMNEVYASFFGEHRPARAAIEVARLPRDARVEISCVAATE
jgi:2-iminobutanoate/2-iminopropanoate deaminase